MFTPKQRAFCEFYAVSHNATDAAIKAGYSRKTARSQGQRMLKNVDVKKYLEETQREAHSEAVATKREILEFLTETMRSTETGKKDRLKAAQMLGDYYTIFKQDRIGDEEAPPQVDVRIIDCSGEVDHD